MEYIVSEIHEYACLIIGDEILEGNIIESNSLRLIKALAQKGYVLKESRVIGDDIDKIACTLSEMRRTYSFVITTGGIGPTHDDVTFRGIAKSFNVETILHTDMLKYFLRKKRTPRAQNGQAEESQIKAVRQMSTMPESIELIHFADEWPLLKIENCYIMPGLPSVCNKTIRTLSKILPFQRKRFSASLYMNAHEHHYFEWLQNLALKYQSTIDIGSYPIDTDSDLRQKGIISKISLIASNLIDGKKCFDEISKYIEPLGWLVKKTELMPIHTTA